MWAIKSSCIISDSQLSISSANQLDLPSRLDDGRISTSLVQPQSAATKAVPRGQCMETLPEGAIWINFFSSVRSAKLVQTESKSR